MGSRAVRWQGSEVDVASGRDRLEQLVEYWVRGQPLELPGANRIGGAELLADVCHVNLPFWPAGVTPASAAGSAVVP